MSDKSVSDSKKQLIRFADLYMTDMSRQWIAALPLILIGSMPLYVFILRLISDGYYMPYHMLDPLRTVFCCSREWRR